MATTASLELVQLTKMYGDVTAVDAINLRIPAGSYCCLLGPSGCGKTSTLRMIAGHESATSGDIIVGPKNVTDLPPAGRNTAMMFQSYALFPHLSVIDHVAFALKMRGIDKVKRHAEAQKLLELVDMQGYAARLPKLEDLPAPLPPIDADLPLDVDEGDAMEQYREVELDEDDYR